MRRIDKILVGENVSLRSVMKLIDSTGYDFIIVVDKNKKLKGVVTDGDIRRGIIKGATIKDPIKSVMTKKPVYIVKGQESQLPVLFKTMDVVGRIPILDKNNKVLDLAMETTTPLGEQLVTSFNKQAPTKKDKKVLVIGGAGYIGSVLVRRLLRRGYKVRVLDLLLYGDDSIKELRTNDNFEFIKGDTRHIDTLTESMRDVSSVVHLAELVGDPACEKDSKTTLETNLFATSQIGQISKHFMINRMIYMSSCSVYGAQKNIHNLLTENSPLEPLSLYAKMKLESEKTLLLLADDVFAPCILRLGTVYGYSYRPRFDLVVNLFTAKAFYEGKITVFGGDQWRPNVHVNDVCNAIIKVLEAPINKIRGEIFNVGSEEGNHQVKSIGRVVKKLFPGLVVEVLKEEVDKRDYKICFEKIRDTLGFRAKKTVKQGIKEIKLGFEKGLIKDWKNKNYRNVP